MHIRGSLRLRMFGSALTFAPPASYSLVAGLSHQGWIPSMAAASIAISAASLLGAILIGYWTYALLTRSNRRVGTALKTPGDGRPARIGAIVPSELRAPTQAPAAANDLRMTDQAELHDQLRRTMLLTRLAIDLRAALDPATIVRDILTALDGQNDAGATAIVLVGPDGAIELAQQSTGGQPRPMPLEQARRALRHEPAGGVWRAGTMLLMNDAQDTRWGGYNGADDAGSVLALPLAHGRATFGVLTISHPKPGHFTSHDLLLFEGVAAQASVALSAARLREEQRRRRDQALLLPIGQALTSERSMEQLAADLLERSASAFDAGATAIFLAEPGTAALSCFAAYTGSLAESRQAAELLAHMAAAAERAWQTGIPTHQLLPDADEAATDQIEAPSGIACVALPLRVGGDAIGAFVLARRARGTALFSADTWVMLTVLATTVAASFAPRQLSDQPPGQAERLQQISEQTSQLMHSRDPMYIIFDHLPDGLVLIEAEGRILTANDVFCEDVLGVLPRAVVGQRYSTIIEELERDAQITIEPHPSIPSARRARCAADGRPRWYEIDRYVVGSGDGAEQVIERWRDITRQEEQPRDQPIATMARLAASVVHEIGNPLQSLRSCIDLSREDTTLAAPTAEYLELASSELKRMSEILGRLRDLQRVSLNEANDE
jgi:GAF domain-containing protein